VDYSDEKGLHGPMSPLQAVKDKAILHDGFITPACGRQRERGVTCESK